MSAHVAIRRASKQDADRLGQLAGQLVRMHHSANPDRFLLVPGVEHGYGRWLAREMTRDEAIVLVATTNDEVIGYAYGTLEDTDWNALLPEHGKIHDVFVDPTHRRAGTGAALLDALLAELEKLGAPRIVLSTMVDNAPAQRLFETRGFRPTMLEMTRASEGQRGKGTKGQRGGTEGPTS